MAASSRIHPSRIDGRDMKQDEMCRGRFSLEISSVSYFIDHSKGKRCAAVLLSTQFKLEGRRLATAKVPLSAPLAQVDFGEYYPAQKEYVKIGEQDIGGLKEIEVKPSFKNVEIGGVHAERHWGQKDHPAFVTLAPFTQVREADVCLAWLYQGSDLLDHFPSPVKVLVVVNKPLSDSTMQDIPFPFKLCLDWNIEVALFGFTGLITKLGDILVHSLKKHDGWSFEIKGPYNSEEADKVYENARFAAENSSPLVGLKHAMSLYSNAPWQAPGLQMAAKT